MERVISIKDKEQIEKKLQEEYLRFIQLRVKESIEKRVQVRLIINIDNGRVTSLQDQAIIMGSTVLDMYGKRVVVFDNN